MRKAWIGSGLVVGLVTFLACGTADARLTRLVVEQREPFVGGVSWGETGPYERLVGTAHMEVDPRDPLNAVIVDLDTAERLANGDSRRSLAERYKDHRGFVKAVEHAARKLVQERFLLPEDAQRYIEAAEASDVLK